MHILEYIQGFFSGTFAFIFLLGLLIFVHELGHFAVARWCGVRVETFSLGFGKKIWQRKRGDTVYCISIIPFGGYVKMFGEQPGAQIAESDKSVSFTHKTIWQRMAIVLAGPLVNFFFAIVVFTFIAMHGELIPPAKLGDIEISSKAFAAGFRSGDSILQVQNESVLTVEQLRNELNKHKDETIAIQIKSEAGQLQTLNVKVDATENKNPLMPEKTIGDVDGLQFYSQGTAVGVSGSSPLYAIGLKPGDRITSVNGQKVSTFRALNAAVEKLTPGSELIFEADRGEDEKAVEKININYKIPSNLADVSLKNLQLESSEFFLSRVVENSPAQAAGLKVGDRISKINNNPVLKWDDVLTNVKSFDGKNPLKLEVLRGIETVQLDITPKMTTQQTLVGEDKRFTIGIAPYANLVAEEPLNFSIANPVKAVARAITRTMDSTVIIFANLAKLVTGEISPKNIGGIISIGQAAHETFKRGLSYYLHLMAILSVNLFILNMLPIPVLDGGHFLFYIIEAVKGSPVSLKKMEIAQQVGMALLLVLMVYALYNDVTKFLPL